MREADPGRTLGAPRDVNSAQYLPRPGWAASGTFAQIVDYELTATFAALETAAKQSRAGGAERLRDEPPPGGAGLQEAPYAWVIPSAQRERLPPHAWRRFWTSWA